MAIRTQLKAAGDDVVPENLGGAHDATALEQEPVRHTELDAPLVVGEDVAAELDEGHVWATGDGAASARVCETNRNQIPGTSVLFRYVGRVLLDANREELLEAMQSESNCSWRNGPRHMTFMTNPC